MAVQGRPRTRGPQIVFAARVLLLSVCILTWSRATTGGQSEPVLRILDVPYVSQTEALCGGAAASMVLRYWGERGLNAESFAHLVDASAGGIRTTALLQELNDRGWIATAVPGSEARLADEIDRAGRPVLALIQDRPGTFHYVVVVGVPARAVVFHDPARTPYRVMSRDEFRRRWSASSYWMAVVVPRERPAGAIEPRLVPPPRLDGSSGGRDGAPLDGSAPRCEALVTDGVRLAQSGDFEGAERSLTSALACPGGAAYRELAGLRALQRRWPDAAELASTATQADAMDAAAWRLLATARFLEDDRPGALAAWNAVGEPTVDTVQVSGLTRTRAAVVERAIGIPSGEVLSQDAIDGGRRRLTSLPALQSSSLGYAPVAGGRAEVRATVNERGLLPSGLFDYGPIAARAIFTREARVSLGAWSGGGERLDLQYRFRPKRPRVALALQAPAPWGGVWGVEGAWERQPFDTGLLATSERTSGRLAWSDWLTGRLQVAVRGGVDRWVDLGARGALGGTVRVASIDDRVIAHADVDAWIGDTRFTAARLVTTLRSSTARRGIVLVGVAGAGAAGDAAPVDLWFAGDPGSAGHWPVLLRAHALVGEATFFRTAQMGRSVVHGSAEAQYWWAPKGVGLLQDLRVGAAVFVDSAHVTRRLRPGDRDDVDAGLGLRVGVPGGRGTIRIDAAQGLVNGDTKFSFVYEP